MADKQKTGSFFDEEDLNSNKHRESREKSDMSTDEDTSYFSEISRLKEQEDQNKKDPKSKEQTEEDNMEDL